MNVTNRFAIDDQASYGLLLGGGGIRGCAHAGILSVLDQIGLDANVVVGSSIGSIFGCAFAAGWRSHDLRRLTDAAPRRAVAEFYLNRLRIDRKTYIGSLLCELGENTQIEDLPKRFAAMVLDKETGQAVPITRGPLLQAVEASIALPGFAKPVRIGDRLYIDGGLRGAIPSSVAYDLGADHILRVELVGSNVIRQGIRRFAKSPLSKALSKKSDSRIIPEVPSVNPGHPPEVVIFPKFYGLFCNSPLGVAFCVRRGQIAAQHVLATATVESGSAVGRAVTTWQAG